MTNLDFHRADGLRILSERDIEKIETLAARILEEIGIEFQGDAVSLNTLKAFGASVENTRVRLDMVKVTDFIVDHAPHSFVWNGGSAGKSVLLGKQHTVFAPVYGPPRVKRLDGSITAGTIAEYRELVSLCDASDALQTTGFMLCYVHDVAEQTRHLEMAKAHLELSDKPFMGTVFSEKALNQVVDLLGRGEPAQGECNLLHLINSTPPLVYQKNPLQCLRAACLRGEGCVVTSYMMMGATSAVSLIGSVAQGYAEVLAGILLTQLYRAGAPVIFGLYAMPFSMHTMQPVFGDPVSNLIQLAGIQLAGRLGIPCRGDGGVTSSNVDDALAGYEGGAATYCALHGRANFILHSAGWLESGRCADMGKLIRETKNLKALQHATGPTLPQKNDIH